MLGPPPSAFAAGGQAVVVAALLLLLGYLVVDVVAGKRDVDEVERWGLSLAGLSAFALVLMLVHIATAGAVFSRPGLARGVVLGTTIILGVRSVVTGSQTRKDHVGIALALAIVAVVVWCSPVFRMMPLTATADTQLHNGWIDQLMSGERVPKATLTGDIPNYYPWLFHALGATTTSITPGGSPFHALAPLQILQVAGIALALFALGRALTRRALTGASAALLGAMSGGFGFVLLRGLDVVPKPRARQGEAALTYHGDLLFDRSYNLSLHNLVPPFPRDIAFALLVCFVLLLALRVGGGWWPEVGAGVVLGLVGLTGGETFLVASLVALAMIAIDAERRFVTAVRLLLPAAALYSLWLIPIAINYARLDGFVSITHIQPLTLPASAILVSWGLLAPFAAAGLVSALHHFGTDRQARLCIVLAAAAGAILVLSTYIPELFGDAFDTLGRKHRYWPIFYLGMVPLGALGVTIVGRWLAARARPLAAAALIAMTAIAWASPLAASLAVPAKVDPQPDIAAAMRQQDGNLLHELRGLGRGCVAALPEEIQRHVFAFTGFRLVVWTGNWLGPNRARIRWAGIYEHITPEARRIADNETLVTGSAAPQRWREVAAQYGVNVVVSRPQDSGARGFVGMARLRASFSGEPFDIRLLAPCGDADAARQAGGMRLGAGNPV